MVTTASSPVGKDVTSRSTKVTKGKENMDAQAQPEGHMKNISSEEGQKFLKLIKKSDFNIVDQLGQTPSKIPIISLLLSSKAYRTALMKVLNAAHVMHDISVDQFDEVVSNITSIQYLGFNNVELPAEGTAHNKALHISSTCMDTLISRVQVDIGSSLNVFPKNTLSQSLVEGT